MLMKDKPADLIKPVVNIGKEFNSCPDGCLRHFPVAGGLIY